jgi:hypothetical protein
MQEDQRNPIPEHSRQERRRRWPFVLGGAVVAIGVLVAVWDWDWFRPLIAHEASAALGRPVSLQHFRLRLGRQTVAVADGVSQSPIPRVSHRTCPWPRPSD